MVQANQSMVAFHKRCIGKGAHDTRAFPGHGKANRIKIIKLSLYLKFLSLQIQAQPVCTESIVRNVTLESLFDEIKIVQGKADVFILSIHPIQYLKKCMRFIFLRSYKDARNESKPMFAVGRYML